MRSVEPDLTPYQAIKTIDAAAVLVIAPHADDEVFGCGGAIAAHVQDGVAVHVVILTDGAQAGEANVRARESRSAAAVLGYGEPAFWNEPDRKCYSTESSTIRLVELIRLHSVDLVYCPSPWEVHPDHRQACLLAQEAALRVGWPVRLAFYEVGVPLRPNVLLDLSNHWENKKAAMRCFNSQLARQDYARHIEALNTYRTYTLPEQVQAAEAYWVVTAADIASGAVEQQVRAVSPGTLAPATASDAALPLVSVLIRSMDPDCLTRTLDSVALQTYPHIEVVVVAARPDHRHLPARCGLFPLRVEATDVPLARSAAANKALLSGKGEWLLLLDDDDWLLPEHIARLVRCVASQSGALAAYTGIALVDTMGRPIGQTLDLPFDRTRLRSGNLMPIHAVLFNRRLVLQGCRFDETLDRYEDWDFWLQVSEQTVMAHVPGVSAVYQIHHSSGVHEESGPRTPSTQAIYEKWSPRWSEDTWASLMERNWAFPDLEQAAHQSARLVADLRAQAQAMQQELAASQERLAAIYSSRSWRWGAPIRWLGAKTHPIRGPVRRLQKIVASEGWNGVRYRIVQRVRGLIRPPMSYSDWVARHGTPSAAQLQTLRTQAAQWSTPPLLSIVMPVYNPPLHLLREAVQSIQQQTYERWELCMADDASTSPQVWPCLLDMAAKDPRIKVVRRAENGHISRASNSALELASGDFIVLMDNDDLLPPDALHWITDAIVRRPSVQVLYSDEDKLDAQGERFGPYFKADWNHTLFMGHNMISHLGVYRTALVRELGGFREGYEGSQDYDLALRCIEQVHPADIVHIPRVLYHWRAIEGSTALTTDSKPYALLAAQRALTEHLARTGRSGCIEISDRWNYRWLREVPKDISLSLIIFDHGPQSSLEPLQAAWRALGQQRELKIVNCAPNGNSLAQALREAHGDLIALAPATEFDIRHADALRQIAGWALDTEVGIAGGTLRDAAGRILQGGLVLNPSTVAEPLMQHLPRHNAGYLGRAELPQELSAVSMGCMVIRKSLLTQWGGPDPFLGMTYLAATEWCLRLREAGLKVIWHPEAEWACTALQVQPLGQPSPEQRAHFHKQYRSRYQDWLAHDPAYHDALDALAGDFSLQRTG